MGVTAQVTGGNAALPYLLDLGRKIGAAKEVRVGFLEGATYDDGTPVAMIAAIQNFGAPSRGIPPRPFFSNMVKAKASEWGPAFAMAMQDADNNSAVALTRMGEGISGQLRQSIIDTNTPPLAPATIRRKGFDKPLVDTDHMLGSVDYEVKT